MSEITQDVAVRGEQAPVGLVVPPADAGMFEQLQTWMRSASVAQQLAVVMSAGPFAPRGFRGSPEATATAILAGMELGFSPSRALRSFHVVEGNATLSAEAMRALVLAKGHELEVERGEDRVTIRGRRRGQSDWTTATWTVDDAIRAELLTRKADGTLGGKDNWRKYPLAMLANRATTDLCKLVFADVIGGMDGLEELQDADPASIRVDVEVDRPRAVAAAVLAAAVPEAAHAERAVPPAEPVEVTHPHAGEVVEPAVPEAPPAGQIDEKTWARINARFVELGVTGPRQTAKRMAVIRAVVGREVSRGGELTEQEGSDVLGHLSAALVRDVLTAAPAPVEEPGAAAVVVEEPAADLGGADPDADGDYDPTAEAGWPMDGAEAAAEGQP